MGRHRKLENAGNVLAQDAEHSGAEQNEATADFDAPDGPVSEAENQAAAGGDMPPPPSPPKDGKRLIRNPDEKAEKLLVMDTVAEFNENGIAELDSVHAEYLLSIPGYTKIS